METKETLVPFVDISDLQEPALEAPTLADTAAARFNNGAYRATLNFTDELRGSSYDPNFDIEKYIEKNGYSGALANFLRVRGSASKLDADRQLDRWTNTYAPAQRTLRDSSALNRLGTDPVFLTSVLWPFAMPARAMKTLNAGARLRQQNLAREVLGKQPLSFAEIGMLEGAVIDGSITMSNALRNMEEGADPDDELLRAGILTATSIAAGGVVGKGYGEFLSPDVRALQKKARVDAFNKGMSDWLEVSRNRQSEGLEPQEFDYKARWFTNSPFFKALPSPMKSVITDPNIPNWFKGEVLELANDSGLMLVLNQSGKTVGNSVHQRAARRNGEWVRAYEKVREAWSTLNPRGGADFANVEVQNAFEIIRKRIGKDSFTINDFAETLGRAYIKKDTDNLTKIEKDAIDSIRKYFNNAYEELTDAGLLRDKSYLFKSISKKEKKMESDVDFYEKIFDSSVMYLVRQSEKHRKTIDDASKIIDQLNADEVSRGLTKKQLAFRERLRAKVNATQLDLDEVDEIFEVIHGVETIDDMFAARDFLRTTQRQDRILKDVEKQIEKNREIIEDLRAQQQAELDRIENWFPRFYNRPKIRADREGFKQIIVKHMEDKPYIFRYDEVKKKFVKIELDNSPEAISKRADEFIETILEETDEDVIEAIMAGRGKHFMRRGIDIPTENVIDYVQTNVRDVMIAYSDRIGPRLEFQKSFGQYGKVIGKTSEQEIRRAAKFEDVDKGLRVRLAADGVDEDTINKAMRDFTVLYDRVVGQVIKNPDALSRKTVNWLKTVTSWTYLGQAGVAATADVATLFMDHEARNVAKALGAMWDDVDIKAARREIQLAGEALDIVKNISHVRHMEALSRDVFNDLPDKINNFFYTANGLGPVTVLTKTLDSLVRGHTIIEASIKKVTGEASQFDIEFLARYNIDESMAERLGDLATRKGSPIEQSNNGLFLPNTESWVDDELVDIFRNALRSGVANRIIMAGPADKPIMMDGVAYIPMRIARQFGMSEDPVVKGYARYENAFLSLPFTFYTYTIGAANKITANYAQGAVRSKALHFAVAMGLGYSIVKYRTPDWKWKDMDPEDKAMRAFDFSGLAAFYSDMMYRSLETMQAFGMEDMMIEPRFKQKPDPIGGIVSIAGAPADYAYDGVKALNDFMTGNFSDGAKQVGRMLPFSGLMMIDDTVKGSVDAIAGALPNRP